MLHSLEARFTLPPAHRLVRACVPEPPHDVVYNERYYSRDLEGLRIISVHLIWDGVCRLSGFLAYLQSSRHIATAPLLEWPIAIIAIIKGFHIAHS
jgi:hypothetical protein